MDLRNTRTTILNQGSAEDKREEIRQYFHKTYTLDGQIYETLAGQNAFYRRAEPHMTFAAIREFGRKFQHAAAELSAWKGAR